MLHSHHVRLITWLTCYWLLWVHQQRNTPNQYLRRMHGPPYAGYGASELTRSVLGLASSSPMVLRRRVFFFFLATSISVAVGDGRRALFWSDSWLHGCTTIRVVWCLIFARWSLLRSGASIRWGLSLFTRHGCVCISRFGIFWSTSPFSQVDLFGNVPLFGW
jgi:hypothetical protein